MASFRKFVRKSKAVKALRYSIPDDLTTIASELQGIHAHVQPGQLDPDWQWITDTHGLRHRFNKGMWVAVDDEGRVETLRHHDFEETYAATRSRETKRDSE